MTKAPACKPECVAIPLEKDCDELLSRAPPALLSPRRREAGVYEKEHDHKDTGVPQIDSAELQCDILHGSKTKTNKSLQNDYSNYMNSVAKKDEHHLAVHEKDQAVLENPSNIHDISHPQFVVGLSTSPLQHPSALSIPCATIAESHGSCYISDGDLHRHHQLCIAIDEDSPVSYSASHLSIVCSSGVNERDAPGLDVRTHSRNVSETPSLPPFYSSSTSSAYHSRNSSLGSQLSSCFESDSMLNQLTDIDSCLAVHTGSHGDLKRRQDSRYSRRGDVSPSSHSSDLDLYHHMNKPFNRDNSMVDKSPMNLEETLRNLSIEKLNEYKKSMSIKSSDWIKHQMECHKDSLVVVKVSSKTKHVVHFNVRAGDIIIWEFATKKKDIAFGVSFEATEVATAQSPLPDSHESLDNKMSAILPTFRVNTYAHPTIGTHIAALDGIYEIIFDNTYSRFFAKELYYRITTQPSQPNDNYSKQ